MNSTSENFPKFLIRHNKELGRHLVAQKDIDPDEIIFETTPLLIGPKTTRIQKGLFPCVGCLKSLDSKTYRQCPGCNWPCCSKNCIGLKDETLHGFECQILRLRPSDLLRQRFYDYFRFDVLSIIRAFSLLKLDRRKWDAMMELENHLDVRVVPNSPTFRLITEKVLHLQVNYLKPWKDKDDASGEKVLPQFLSDLAHKIYGILETNVVLYDGDSCDGIILYPLEESSIEHSCLPNCTEDIDRINGFKMRLRALTSIKEEQHISRNYLNTDMNFWGTQKRIKYLKEQRYVPCTCGRCQDSTEFGTNLSGLKCLGMETIECGGVQLPKTFVAEDSEWCCNKCDLTLPSKKLMDVVVYIEKEVEKQLDKRYVELEDMQDFLKKLLIFFHPNHYLACSVKYRLLEMFNLVDPDLSKEVLEERLKICEDIIDVAKKIDPANARVANRLVVLQNTQFSIKFKILLKTFTLQEKQSSMPIIEDILQILAESKKILKRIQSSESTKKLFQAVCLNELKISNWIQENGIKI